MLETEVFVIIQAKRRTLLATNRTRSWCLSVLVVVYQCERNCVSMMHLTLSDYVMSSIY